MSKELRVLIADEEIGSVFQGGSGRLTFIYDDAWRSRIDPVPLSLSMPLTQREHGHNVVSNYMWGLLSDDPVARSEMARRHDVSARSAFALVAASGEDLAGAVQMVPPEALPKLIGRKGAPPISDKRLAEFLANLVRHPGQTQITRDAGVFSLPGVQPKKAICWVGAKWYEPRGRTPSTHIIKPPVSHLHGQVENEHFCLRLAAAAGLRSAKTEVVSIGGVPNVVVERYDRIRLNRSRTIPLSESGGTVYRVHQEDVCQALGYHPDKKYQRDGGPGVREVMNLLSESGDAATDRDRFMRASVFNFVILGIDAHAKNYSLLLERGGRFRLAPLYDIISALPYDTEHYNSLAMNVGGERKWRRIGPSNWEKEARACRYSVDATFRHLREMIELLPDAAERLLSEAQRQGLTTSILPALVDELVKRCNRLRAEYAATVV
jgi:serine/threonine-protein kinase HipA